MPVSKDGSGVAPFTIRPATVADVDTLAKFRMRMGEELGGEHPDPNVDWGALDERNRRYFRERLADGQFIAFIADAAGGAVACGGMTMIEKPPHAGNELGLEGYILNMYTTPEWRGKGIARAIVRELLAAARERGATTAWLRASDMGRPVYEAEGFTTYDRYMQIHL